MEVKKFDTPRLTQNLEAAGVPDSQAEAIVAGIRDARTGLATKADLDALEVRLDAKLATLRADLCRALWIQGAGTIILAAKPFG